MPETITFKALDEKHLLCIIHQMFWSPKMDLIAIATLYGEVMLYRLSLHKVWTIKKLDDSSTIITMAWRSDGKILSVAYYNNQISVHCVESGELLHSYFLFGSEQSIKISFLSWSPEFNGNTKKLESEVNYGTMMEELSFEYKLECSSDLLLPNLPEFSKQEFKSISKFKDIKSEKMSILIVGDTVGRIHLYAYGFMKMAVINLPKAQKVLNATFSNDFSTLSVVTYVYENYIDSFMDVYLCDTIFLQEFSKEILAMYSSFTYIWTLTKYVNVSISEMKESWEDILLEIDLKINKLAEEKYKRGLKSIRRDLLMLLVYGRASDEMKDFMHHDLTSQSLSKLGKSMLSSYSNIQKLLLNHLQSVIQRISYELAEIKGLSLIIDRYSPLGLIPEDAAQALDMAGSFMLKSVELQQVIEKSLTNFKAFYGWISSIKSLSSTTTHKQSNKQKVEFVAQYINENFNMEFDPSKRGIRLEKVGQYLENEDLSCPLDMANSNSWATLLKSDPQLAQNPLIYKAYSKKSLIQLQDKLNQTISKVLTNCLNTTSKSFLVNKKFTLAVDDFIDISSVRQILSNNNEIFTAFSLKRYGKKSEFCVLKQDCNTNQSYLSTMKIDKIGDLHELDIKDMDFFNSNILVMLVQSEVHFSFISQISIAHSSRFIKIEENLKFKIGANDFKSIDLHLRLDGLTSISNIPPIQMAVSGLRKTACILFSCRRRIKLFLAEDDDDSSMHISRFDWDLEFNQQDSSLNIVEIMDYSIDNDNKENTV